MKTLLKNGNIMLEETFEKMDIAIDGGKVFAIAPRFNIDEFEKVIHCDNFFIMPGFVDVHVHLREPGYSYKETIKTGTKAAAKGGFTTVFSMPNLNPPPTNLENLEKQLNIIEKDGVVKVLPYGAITETQSGKGNLSEMERLSNKVVAFSDDGKGIQEKNLMKKAMLKAKSLNKIIVAHCEDETYDTYDKKSEYLQVERDIQLLKETGCSYHVCHVSTKEAVELIRSAKKEGLDITCETAPHYLIFNEGTIKKEGNFKMNPPIRGEEDRLSLIEGIKDGTIDIIATDHAPHSMEEKSKGFKNSLFGIVGLETAFSVLYTNLVEKEIIDLRRLIELISINPRKRFNLEENVLKEGSLADITIIDIKKEIIINSNKFESMGKSTPFENMKVKGSIVATLVNGEII